MTAERIAELEAALAAKDAEIQRLRFKLYGQFCADRGVKGCDHSTACSIWGDDGQGNTVENFPQPLPCNCGALENYRRHECAIASQACARYKERAEAAEIAYREEHRRAMEAEATSERHLRCNQNQLELIQASRVERDSLREQVRKLVEGLKAAVLLMQPCLRGLHCECPRHQVLALLAEIEKEPA